MPKTILLFLVTALLTLAGAPFIQGDDIVMKSGETFTGRITYEADDIVKIEIPVSASIKETKILLRKDIAEIKKQAPDDVAVVDILKMVPSSPLMSAEAYKSSLETGPNSFLRKYPDSKHVEKVKEIKATLEEELDKVERGYIKVEEDWISPQDKVAFSSLIESRVHFLKMDAYAQGGNVNSNIAAMREFEIIEEQYFGSPAFPKALTSALQIVPVLGRQLQSMYRDVEYRNAEYERKKAEIDPIARAQVEAAREREIASYDAAMDEDKEAGIKWFRLNPRSKEDIESYLSLASSELERIKEYDVALLTEQAEKLVAVDELIAKDELATAKAMLSSAASMSGTKLGSSGKKGKGSGKTGSYIASLNSKLNEKLAAQATREKAATEAKKSQALTDNLRKSNKGDEKAKEDSKEATAEENADKKEMAEGKEDPEAEKVEEPKEEKTSGAASDFAALATKKPEKEKEEPKKSSKSSSKKKSSSDDDDEEEEEKPRPEPADEGGFPMFLIPAIITVLVIVAIVILKVLGIGGKKESDE